MSAKRSASTLSAPTASAPTRAARVAAGQMFEGLENRALFSVLSITGTAGADVIGLSRSGDQIVVDQNGTATSYPAAGVTQVTVGAGAGNDSVLTDPAFDLPAVIAGGDGNDRLTGGAAGDTIYGNDGLDSINGNGGNDRLYAGNAPLDLSVFTTVKATTLLQKNTARPVVKTTIVGLKAPVVKPVGPGPIKVGPTPLGATPTANVAQVQQPITGRIDTTTIQKVDTAIIGTAIKPGGIIKLPPIFTIPTDAVDGDAGNDTIYGGPNVNVLHGDDGADTIYGGTGSNAAFGDAGDDLVYGAGNAANTLHGGDGNDVVSGSKGSAANTVLGEGGDDRLYARGTGTNNVWGGTGNDHLFAGPAQSNLNGEAGDDVLVSIGGSTADVSRGGDGLDMFWADAEGTEKTPDLNLFEALLGTGHRVSSFANGASRHRSGQNLADPESSRLRDDGTKYYPASANFADHALFATGGPGPNDVNQGQNGDCYFLAALSTTAKVNPLSIRKSVVDLGDGTYAVQFWKNGSAQFYRVDADLPVWTNNHAAPYYAGFGAQGSMWVPVMEKAFAMFRTGANTYQSIWWGGDDGFRALNGKSISTISGTSATNLLNNIKAALDAGKEVIAGTPGGDPTNGCPCVGGHMYSVDRVNMGNVWVPGLGVVWAPVSITVRNPWGYDGAGNDGNTGDAYVTCTASQFYGYFSYVGAAYV